MSSRFIYKLNGLLIRDSRVDALLSGEADITSLATKVDKPAGNPGNAAVVVVDASGNVSYKDVDQLINKETTETLEVNVANNAVLDMDHITTQYSFYYHTASFHTTVNDKTVRVTFKTNLTTPDVNLLTMSAVYDHFDEIANYMESCLATRVCDDGSYDVFQCKKVEKATLTRGDLLTNSVKFVFTRNI